jgi:hypothetical protein
METRCVKIKLEADSVDWAKEWAQVISERRGEALASFPDRGQLLKR